MTQQSLITRLKAVEEALSMFSSKVKHEINGADESCFVIGMREQVSYSQMLAAATALSDLRELIKEAEGQKPAAYGDRLGTHLQSVWPIPSTGVPLWMSYEKPLYTALGEKP